MRRTIELEFSETDRQTAERYVNTTNCIVATALKNRGLNVVSVHSDVVYLEDGKYNGFGGLSPVYVGYDFQAREKPFYHPEVVGKKLVLVSERDDYAPEETPKFAEVVA